MIIFKNCEKKIEKIEIADIEKIIKLIFPEQYKEHILKFNGGESNFNKFNFLENGKMTSSRVHWFLAIYDGEDYNLYDYIEIFKIYEKRLPSHILPIACDDGGNLVCISCKGKDNGAIYFWDHESEIDYEVEDDFNYHNLYKIEDSFYGFINSLY